MNDEKRLVKVTDKTIEIDNLKISLFKHHVEGERETPTHIFNKLHIHTHHEIVVCYSGTAELVTAKGAVTLSAGDAVLIPHDYLHTMKLLDASGRNWASMTFGCTKLERGATFDLWKRYKTLITSDSPLIYRGVEGMVEQVREILAENRDSESVRPILKLAMMLDELSHTDSERISPEICLDKVNSEEPLCDDTRLAIVNEIINSCYKEDIDINKLASDLYVSRRHLDRIVKGRFGHTMQELINKNRLEFAKNMLLESSYSTEKIASVIGFSSKEAFVRSFRNKFGVSPTDFRKTK